MLQLDMTAKLTSPIRLKGVEMYAIDTKKIMISIHG